MDIQEKEVLIAEIERFKEEALNMHIVQVLAHTYTITSIFDYSIDSDGSVIWYKAQACQLWDFWQAAKAQAVPEGFVLVPMVPSERMINAVRQCYEGEAYLPYSLYSEFVNQAIIERMEAQEPAND